jgi:hypothetical protein
MRTSTRAKKKKKGKKRRMNLNKILHRIYKETIEQENREKRKNGKYIEFHIIKVN